MVGQQSMGMDIIVPRTFRTDMVWIMRIRSVVMMIFTPLPIMAVAATIFLGRAGGMMSRLGRRITEAAMVVGGTRIEIRSRPGKPQISHRPTDVTTVGEEWVEVVEAGADHRVGEDVVARPEGGEGGAVDTEIRILGITAFISKEARGPRSSRSSDANVMATLFRRLRAHLL